MQRILSLFLSLFLITGSIVQAQQVQRPKLVVGIVVDQMRWDYLYRFNDRYSPDGFKRMLTQGFLILLLIPLRAIVLYIPALFLLLMAL